MFSPTQGHVHYLRFCFREDLESGIIDKCETFTDLPKRFPPSAGDLVLYTKRWLGDQSIAALHVVVPQEHVQQIREGHSDPAGVAALRPIGDKVAKNINRYGPVCVRQGDITQAAFDYLSHWVSGSLPVVPRPKRYDILSHRWCANKATRKPHTWSPPGRVKVVDVSLGRDDDVDSGTESEGAVDMEQ